MFDPTRVKQNTTIRLIALFVDDSGDPLGSLTPDVRVRRTTGTNKFLKNDATWTLAPSTEYTATAVDGTNLVGVYYFDFALPDEANTYIVRIDGGATAGNRYQYLWLEAISVAETDIAVPADVDASLAAINLDHLCKTATAAADMTAEIEDDTILSRILAAGDTSDFDPDTDSLTPIATGLAALSPEVGIFGGMLVHGLNTELEVQEPITATGDAGQYITIPQGRGVVIRPTTNACELRSTDESTEYFPVAADTAFYIGPGPGQDIFIKATAETVIRWALA